jgi:RNA polymerase sigma factor (TIGR02999 family)
LPASPVLAKLGPATFNGISKFFLIDAVNVTGECLFGSMTNPSISDEIPSWQSSVYEQLHQLAERALRRETPGHSLQPTLLVNDAYLRLLEQRNVDAADRSQVMAAGATIIRRLLVDYARTRKAKKRGGADGRGIPLNISLADSAKTLDVLELNDALEALADENPRASQVVEMRFFGGLPGEEIAEQLDVSIGTVNNDWRFAKAWLYRALGNMG